MRIERSVTSVSWIPSTSVVGPIKAAFAAGVMHYDSPPPEVLGDLERMREADGYRFANELRAWIEVDNGRITGHGYSGCGHMGSTTLKAGPLSVRVPGGEYPDIRREPAVGDESVRFVQTTGGPPPVIRWSLAAWLAPSVWTTLALTIHADGRSEHELVGASPFPRHWIYDTQGRLAAKVSLTRFQNWMFSLAGQRNPWHGRERAALVAEAESHTERELSAEIMAGSASHRILRLGTGKPLVKQDRRGHSVFLLLDGMLEVSVDGVRLTRVGPGAVIGERAYLGDGRRTATAVAVTPVRVAIADPGTLTEKLLRKVAGAHRREERG